MGISTRGILWLLAICFLTNSDYVTAQAKRTSRSGGLQTGSQAGPTARSLGTNPKSSASGLVDFDCPEEFGYFPHPNDCTQYYVCVFGGALLESCTGGLMYSHELQTCDWPRNVGCEMSESDGPPAPPPPRQQQLTSRIRFSSLPSESPLRARDEYRQTSQQPIAQAQIRTIPPPPEPLRVAPNPVVTSRGQPRHLDEDRHESDIAKLYEETHETLPPVEEEESDRQQRVYRGQPSTVGQVQRDRDGLIQQQSFNAIPQTQGKLGSFSYTAQPQQFRVEPSSQTPVSYNQPQRQQIQTQNNRNYYNTTSSQGYNDPHQYDNYYSIYDDDVELYRDVDYAQQYSTTTKSTSKPSTYRTPTTTTSAPVPQRESYYVQKPQYERQPQTQPPQQPAPTQQIYSDDYSDDELIAQIEEDSPYNIRGTQNQIRTNTRTRGGSHYSSQAQSDQSPSTVNSNRGTHPPRARPTLKPSQSIVSKAQEFVDIYRFPPTRPDPVYPQPTVDKTAAKCRKDVCLLPDCYCGGKEIPAELPVEQVPQIILLTFDDSVNDLNKQLYQDLFEKGRVNPNGCPIGATFYVSHEWTDYSQVQNLYSDGHEIASHTVSHSFGEQFTQRKWTREIGGQREILAAYGGVKLEDVRGMRAPFLSIGGNKMFKMLYDSNFTYDSSMPIYENRPPSWPYTLDYKIFHDCMIPPCPTRSYPGVWEVPMVMWQDLNGGRCSMGDACANPPDADGVSKMLMKNFDRHYTTNRAPFGLYYHAAWFTQPHHKAGFINFLDTINSMKDVWIVTNWQALQWVRDPTPISRMGSFQPFQCNYQDRPKRCNNPKVCNLWHKSGVRYMRTCQPCPEIYPWTGKSGIRSSRIDNEIEEEVKQTTN